MTTRTPMDCQLAIRKQSHAVTMRLASHADTSANYVLRRPGFRTVSLTRFCGLDFQSLSIVSGESSRGCVFTQIIWLKYFDTDSVFIYMERSYEQVEQVPAITQSDSIVPSFEENRMKASERNLYCSPTLWTYSAPFHNRATIPPYLCMK